MQSRKGTAPRSVGGRGAERREKQSAFHLNYTKNLPKKQVLVRRGREVIG